MALKMTKKAAMAGKMSLNQASGKNMGDKMMLGKNEQQRA